MRRIRGLKRLLHEAVDLTTELVREGHESSARGVLRVLGAIEPLADVSRQADGLRREATDLVLGSVRGVNYVVREWTDRALDAAEPRYAQRPGGDSAWTAMPLRSDALGSWPWLLDAGQGLLNGTIGDHLHTGENGLDLGLELRLGDAYLPTDPAGLRAALRGASPKLAVFVHGLGATEWSWCYGGAAYHGDAAASVASLLERDLGFTPVLVRYNSGRHVSENGRLLARAIARLAGAWPTPVEEIALIGHSMGGLVARSACHYAQEVESTPSNCSEGAVQRSWTDCVRNVFCLGSPHRGAAGEKLGHIAAAVLGSIDAPATRVLAKLAVGRSAGIKDMRQGSLVDEDWLCRDPDSFGWAGEPKNVPLLAHARYHFISATFTGDASHPLARFLGDLVVLQSSAAGPSCEEHTFPIEVQNYGGVFHHQLQNHPAVYAQIRAALA